MAGQQIKEDEFKEIFRENLGEFYERALAVFQNYGEIFSFDIVNVLLHAIDKDKVDEVLSALEEHWKNHLSFQHPKARGRFGVERNEKFFLDICIDILGLRPAG